jgi:hypothetical protein
VIESCSGSGNFNASSVTATLTINTLTTTITPISVSVTPSGSTTNGVPAFKVLNVTSFHMGDHDVQTTAGNGSGLTAQTHTSLEHYPIVSDNWEKRF